MELARRRWHGASEWTVARVVSALAWTTLLLVMGVLLPIERAEAVPSPYCPNLTFNVAYGGSTTEQIGYCDGGIFIGVGPTKQFPARGTVTYSLDNDFVTYTHNGTGAQLTDQFVIDDGNGGDITITVNIAPPASSITISPGSLGSLQVGVPVSQQLTATGGTAPYTYALSASTMPPGLTLTSGGLISGTPSSRFNSSFTVVVTDNVGATAQQSYSVTPGGPTYTIDTLTLNRNAVVNTALVVRGGIPPYTVQYGSGTPPPGTSISTTGGTVSGTPTANGNYPLTMQVTDSSTGSVPYTANVSATIVVVDPPTITVNPASLPNGTVGASYTQTLTATGGTSPYTYSVTSGALPAGLVLNPSTGVLSGTPTEAGSFSPTVRATDNTSAFGSRTYSLTIGKPVVTISPAALTAAQIGVSYSATITASGGLAPYTFSATGLPAGLTLATNGALTGTPTQAGSFTPTVIVISAGTGEGSPFTDSRQYTLNVSGPSLTLAPAPGALPAASYGQAYTATFTASGGTQPFTYTSTGTLPPGLTLSTGGVLSGTPTTPGSYNFFVYATDASTGTGSPFAIVESYTLVIAAPTISLSPATLPTPVVGTAYSQQVTASGGATPYSFQVTAGSLPPGLTLAGNGTLSGTPTGTGTFNPTITATDTNGQTGAQAYTFVVASPTLSLSPPSGPLPAGSAGTPYSQTFTASGGTAPYSYDALSALPAGLSLSAGGVLSGTPTQAGTFTLEIEATDSTSGTPGVFATLYSLTITAPTLVPGPLSPATADVGQSYSATLSASGGVAPYSYSVVGGALPAGVTLSSTGALAGTPTEAGSFAFTVEVQDSTTGTPGTATVGYVLTVDPPTLTLSPASGALPGATANSSYSHDLSVSGGTAPYTVTVTSGALPAGLTLSTAGVISGTPTESGSFSFGITARDSTGGVPAELVTSYTLSVSAPTLTLSPATGVLPSARAGESHQITFTASGGIAPYSYSVIAGALPPGLSLSAQGEVTGTPTATGTFNLIVSARDSTAGTAAEITQAYQLVVNAPSLGLSPVSGPLPGGTAGTSYQVDIIGSGGTQPYLFDVQAGALPPGITLSTDGQLSGTPTAAGTFNFNVRMRDATTGGSYAIIGSYQIIIAAPTLVLSPATGALPGATAGTAYSQQVTASGGLAPYSYAITTGALPQGVTLSAGGLLSGTPIQSGTFNITVTATDSTGGMPATVANDYSLTVAVPTLAVDPAALPAASSGEAYTVTLTASGGVAPYTYAFDGPSPAFLTLAADGTLSGTPTGTGSYFVNVRVTDSTGGTAATRVMNYVLDVGGPTLTLSPAPGALPAAAAGNAYQQNFSASGGVAPYSYSLAGGTLPAGLSLATTGVLEGTPTAAGAFSFTVELRDSTSGTPGTLSQAYTLQVAAPTLTLAPAAGALPGATAGTAYAQTFSASGGITPYSYSVTAGALPAGLSLASDGALSGTPTASGTFNFTVTALDGTGGTPGSISQAYSVSVAAPTLTLAPVSATLPAGSAGTAYAQTFSATGGIGPYSFAITAGALPAGLTLAADGSLSGTPTAVGTFNVTVQVTDSTSGTPATATRAYTLVIGTATLSLSPASGPLPAVTAGSSVQQNFTASGGVSPYTYVITAGALPPGLTLSTTTGGLAGTPTSSGTFNFTVTAQDGASGTAAFVSNTYSLTVQLPTLALAPAAGALPGGVSGDAYTQQFTASGGIAPYIYALNAGSLPTGLTLSATGLLSGTPTVAGTFSFSVQGTDSTSGTAAAVTQAYTLTIAAPTLDLSPAAGALPAGTAGSAYSQVFVASGGQAPYTYSVASGALPAGLVLSPAGTLSGVATVAGTFNVSVRATDSTPGVAAEIVQAYTLQIAAPAITVTPTTLTDAERGTPYTASFSASGGVGTYTYSVGTGALPAGVTLSSAGVLAGTPSVSGSFAFQVVATDQLGFTGTVNLTLQIADNAPEVPDGSVTTQAEQDGTFTVTTINGSPITSVAVVQQPANGQVTISGLTLRYTPNDGFAGTDSFRYTATGPGGTSQPATVTVNVVALPAPIVPDQAVSVLAGTAVSIDATAGASGGPFTAVTLVESPADGTTVVQGNNVVYTAPATANGATSVRYTVSNAYGASAPATATITVNPLPTAQPQQRDVIAGGSVQVDLTVGATGGPFTAARVVAVTPSTAGEVSVEASGQAWLLTFSPAMEFAGVATVSFTLDNAYATSAPALVTFNVTARTDPSRDAEVLGILDAQAATTRRFATTQLGNFQQRLERLHSAGEGGSGFQNGLGFQVDRTCDPSRGSVIGDPCRDPAVSSERAGYSEPLPYTRDTANKTLGLWTGGMISSGDADSRTGREGYDFETSGVSAGADYRLSPSFALGAGVGYGRDRTEVGVNGSRSDGDAYTMALYASWHPGRHLFVDWIAGYQLLGFENRRYVTDTGAMVSGKRDGSQWIASLSAGADFQKDQWQWSPYARLDAARAQLDGYTETGTDSGHVLDFKRQDVDTTTISAGLRMSYTTAVAWGRLSPQLRMEYQRELEDPSDAYMQYADLPGGPLYQAQVRGFERNRFVFGAGIVLAAERDLMLRVEYRGLFGDSEQTDHGIMFNIEKKY